MGYYSKDLPSSDGNSFILVIHLCLAPMRLCGTIMSNIALLPVNQLRRLFLGAILLNLIFLIFSKDICYLYCFGLTIPLGIVSIFLKKPLNQNYSQERIDFSFLETDLEQINTAIRKEDI